jgi:antitoxin component YwqK of YwqJK toxin-antitoxin module
MCSTEEFKLVTTEIKCYIENCTEDAVIGYLCKFHYLKVENSEVPRGNEIKIKQILPPNITENILSDYLEIEEIKELQEVFEGFTIERNRIIIGEIFYNDKKLQQRNIFIDKKLIKRQNWYENGIRKNIENWKNGKQEGIQYGFYESGNLRYVDFSINGVTDGFSYIWRDNGTVENIEEFENGKLIKKHI